MLAMLEQKEAEAHRPPGRPLRSEIEVQPCTGNGGIDMDDTQKAKLIEIAKNAKISTCDWPGRGEAAVGYYRGMAFAFARAYCKLKTGDPAAAEMAKAVTNPPAKDALAHYETQFAALGMSNAQAGADTLRHLFVLLLGLGMRESSGQYCEGRDTSAGNDQGDTCEAGLFQCSYNLHKASPLLDTLFANYAGRTDFVEYFKAGVTCSAASWKNWGTGAGADFQALTKACPAFAVEFAAVGLRNDRKHWGPINTHAAELRADSDTFFKQVQDFLDAEGIVEA